MYFLFFNDNLFLKRLNSFDQGGRQRGLEPSLHDRPSFQGGKTYWACVNFFVQIPRPGLKKWRDFKYFIA